MPRSSTARARLVDSACRLVHSGNYALATVEALCADANVHKGTFYYLFPSKRDLVLAAIDEQWQGARSKVLEPAFKADVAPVERFRRFFRLAADYQRGELVRGCPFGNLAAEMATTDPLLRERVSRVFDGYITYFRCALLDAVETGALDEGNVGGAAQTLLACFQGALLLARTRDDATLISNIGEHLLASLLPMSTPFEERT